MAAHHFYQIPVNPEGPDDKRLAEERACRRASRFLLGRQPCRSSGGAACSQCSSLKVTHTLLDATAQ
jgi:hypothetical protein